MVNENNPWSYRGGRVESGVNAGVFSFNNNNGNVWEISFRLVLDYKEKRGLCKAYSKEMEEKGKVSRKSEIHSFLPFLYLHMIM